MLKGRSFLVKMVKDDEAGHQEEVDMTDEIKSHFEKYKAVYITGGAGILFASFTYLYMRGVASQSIRDATGVPAQGAIGVLGERNVSQNIVSGKSNVLNSVSYFSSDRQGPPSWVVRCIETGDVFASQKSAANQMGLSASHLSEHLNGVRDHVSGNHFERICMAA